MADEAPTEAQCGFTMPSGSSGWHILYSLDSASNSADSFFLRFSFMLRSPKKEKTSKFFGCLGALFRTARENVEYTPILARFGL
jgi:hypothetical protein